MCAAEDINNILSSGEVPNLFVKDEKFEVLDAMRPIAKANSLPDSADDLWTLFIDRVRNHLHVVLAMSPIGDGFRCVSHPLPCLVVYLPLDIMFNACDVPTATVAVCTHRL